MSEPAVDFRNYDFVDFGCGQGGSIDAAERMFGGRRGIGLDIDSRKVDAVRMAGYEARVCDVTKISSKANSVRFVMMSHFLEHLPGRNDAVACIKSACNLAREFVFIQQPYFDADGYLFVTGRTKDLIIRGGINIAPLEIDNVVSELAGVAEAAAIGVPDRIYGEEVVLYVAPRPASGLTPGDVLDHCRDRLPAAKVPKEVVFRDALPKNDRGKMDRNALAEIWRRDAGAETPGTDA